MSSVSRHRRIRLPRKSLTVLLRLRSCAPGSHNLQSIVMAIIRLVIGESANDITEIMNQAFHSETGPKQIGDYEILREIGRGGMGIVYKARQKSLNRHVALKVLSTGLGLTTKAIMRFKREAEAAAKLHHSNIVPIYATGDENRVPYYVMELIDGPSLDHVIRLMRDEKSPNGSCSNADSSNAEISGTDVPAWVTETIQYHGNPQLSESSASKSAAPVYSSSSFGSGSSYFDTMARMIAGVADALAHAHDHGVIHRDMKPSNLLLAPDGRLSVNDFGLARMLEQPGMTISGEFMGSPMYMSPEQITAGRIPLDHRTDIYSLGATLYELLTLRPPFPGTQRDQVLSQIIHKEVVPPRKVTSRVPRDLETICLKAMDKDPDRRYQSADQFATDLRRYVDRHAILARRIGLLEKSIRYLKRNPFAGAFLGLLLASIIALSYLGWAAYDRQRIQQLKQIENEFLMAVLRADYDGAHELLREGEQIGADSSWIEFSQGHISLYQGEYESAKSSFDRVLAVNPNDISARSLRAVAHMWGGDEATYYEELSNIDSANADEFEEKLYLGYANCWGNSKESLRLLNQADRMKSNHLLLRVFRARSASLRAEELSDRTKAKPLIDQALIDCKSTIGLLDDTPLVFAEYTMANLTAANIYKRLAAQASMDKQGFIDRVADFRDAAALMKTQLERFPENPDAQYALVTLVGKTHDDRAILELSDNWDRQDVRVATYACQNLGMALFRIREYGRALHWLSLARGRAAKNTRFLEFYVRYADTSRRESREDLLREAKSYVDGKLERNDGSFCGADAMLLMLLGDENAMDYYAKDSLNRLIQGGHVFGPLQEYFANGSDRSITTPEQLIRTCNASPSPITSLMHAHFGLGIEALASRHFEVAEIYFQRCLDGDYFQYYVHWLSDAILAHREDWTKWVP